jgi:hypothetical protein
MRAELLNSLEASTFSCIGLESVNASGDALVPPLHVSLLFQSPVLQPYRPSPIFTLFGRPISDMNDC